MIRRPPRSTLKTSIFRRNFNARPMALQTFRFHHHWSGGGRRAIGLALKFRLKIDVLSVVARSVYVRDVGGDQLLPDAQQVHIVFEITGDSLKHDSRAFAFRSPTTYVTDVMEEKLGTGGAEQAVA